MHAECGFHAEPDGSDVLVAIGPVIQVVIGFDPSQHLPADQSATHPPSMDIQALIDTGAKESHIDANVAKVLKLPIVNRRTISGSNGKHLVDVYLAQIQIPSLNETIFGQFAGVKLVEGGSKHGALLGRAFLKKVIMNYNGLTGQVTLTEP
jgi:predicted aspartyl protease